jgi:hypothetical protein
MLVTGHTHQNLGTPITEVDFHLVEAVQQQVEVCIWAETKKKSSFVEF